MRNAVLENAGGDQSATWDEPSGAPGSSDLESLLTDMLGLVQELLRSDTATILLLDTSATMLECRAVFGDDVGAQHRVRVPIGEGFAGTIAKERRAASIAEVTPAKVANPRTIERGIHSQLGAPLLMGNRLLGVVHVANHVPRDFSDEEVATVVRAAARIAHMVARHSPLTDDALASALQHALIPEVPAPITGLDLAARYVPAQGALGGDWHDAFELPSGKVGLVIGDVEGHGFKAAVVMVRLRSALRSYALEHEEPHEVLARLDTKMQVFEVGTTATVLYAVTEPPFHRLRISSAGHPAPLMASTGDAPAQLKLRADPPLGVDPDLPRVTHEVTLPTGSSVCLFTDGLVERRPTQEDSVKDQFTKRFRRVLDAFGHGDADEQCDELLRATWADTSVVEDDIALLIARPTPLSTPQQMVRPVH